MFKAMWLLVRRPTTAENQRAVELYFSNAGGEGFNYTVTTPSNDFIAPRGVYMLFVLRAGNTQGVLVPSIARIVRLKE